MRIDYLTTYVNKTWRFLSPCFKYYGADFVKHCSNVKKLALGVHDMALNDVNIADGRNLYLLLDKIGTRGTTQKFIDFLKDTDYFKYSYCPDSKLIQSRKIMVILELPENCQNAYEKFLLSEYSKMYSKEELDFLFAKNKGLDYQILTNDIKALKPFTLKLNKKFNTSISEEYLINTEYAFPLQETEEIFNYELGMTPYFNKNIEKTWDIIRQRME